MSRYKWYRKLRGGYWVKFFWGWEKFDKKIYDFYCQDRTNIGMTDTIEDWANE